MRRMERKLDITGEQVGTSRPKSSEGWRKKALYNFSRTSEAAQERTLSSSDRDLKPDVDIAFPSRRQELRQQRWLENRGSGSVLSQSSDNTRYRLQNQGNEVKSRPNERKNNTSELGQRKGGGEGESTELLRLRRDIKAEQLEKMEKMSNGYIDRLTSSNQMRGWPDYPTLHRERNEESEKLDVVRDELEYVRDRYENAVKEKLAKSLQ